MDATFSIYTSIKNTSLFAISKSVFFFFFLSSSLWSRARPSKLRRVLRPTNKQSVPLTPSWFDRIYKLKLKWNFSRYVKIFKLYRCIYVCYTLYMNIYITNYITLRSVVRNVYKILEQVWKEISLERCLSIHWEKKKGKIFEPTSKGLNNSIKYSHWSESVYSVRYEFVRLPRTWRNFTIVQLGIFCSQRIV